MTDTLNINIPFSGFYYSLWDSEIDSVIEIECEYYTSEQEDSESALGNGLIDDAPPPPPRCELTIDMGF